MKRQLHQTDDSPVPQFSPVNGMKRRKTSTGIETSPQIRAPQRRISQDLYRPHAEQHDDEPQPSYEVELAEQWIGDGVFLPADEEVDGEGNAGFGFTGAMAEAFVNHEPLAMFPDASSTVPMNTMSQQRLIQDALAANAPVPFASIRGEEQPSAPIQSSPAWSMFMNTNPENAESPGRPKSSREASSSSRQRDVIAVPNLTPSLLGPQAGSTAPKSSGKLARSQSATAAVPPQQSLSQNHINRSKSHHEEAATQESLADELSMPTKRQSIQKSLAISDLHTTSPPRRKKRKRPTSSRGTKDNDEMAMDELNSDDVAIELPKEQHKPRPSRSRSSLIHDDGEAIEIISNVTRKETKTSSDFLDSDELAAIGLPKEQYKPRPSRRRSKPAAEDEQTEVFVVPDRAARVKVRRSKTMAVSPGQPILTESEKIARMEEMGFEPSHAKLALTNNSGNLEHAIEWLSSEPPPTGSINDDLGKELSRNAGSKKKKKKTKDARNERRTLIEQEQDEPENSLGGNRRSALPAAVSPSTTPKGSPGSIAGLIAMEIPALREPFDTTSDSARPDEEPQMKQAAANTGALDQSIANSGGHNNPGKKRLASSSFGADERHDTTNEAPEVGRGEDGTPAKVPKKRGRGKARKNKQAENSVAVHSDLVADEVRAKTTSDTSDEPVDDTLKEIDKNSHLVIDPSTTSNKGSSASSYTTPPESENIKGSTPVQLERTPEKGQAASTVQHSPINKGKVPYRVGLSRRARIPSLLKIVRK